ncbi:serine/threonine-protein phosphatase 6 regulatory ankyrin repeat subunit A [Patella vulgata]|uniref:serine/threonine-protein phosphatase 6 regulatory ankyrin repeat subunit A n=1 Tax=Patella vulgata TaxID=6465 RepID=UPI0024A7DF26|nr:serine/threonine-protein phosphatase 6 regulatory ankyrin repeat subunit A [Patella vulgata]
MDLFNSFKKKLEEVDVNITDTAAVEIITHEYMALGGVYPVLHLMLVELCEAALETRCLPKAKLFLPPECNSNVIMVQNNKRMMKAAIKSDFMEGVQFLHSKGVPLYYSKSRATNNWSVFIDCIKNNKPEVLKYLLDLKYSDTKPNTEETLFMLSSEKPMEESLVYLLNSELIKTFIEQSMTRLHDTDERTRDIVLECVKLMVEAGSHLNLEDSNGKTPVQLAAEHGMVTTVTYLAQKGASLDIKQHHINLLHCLAKSKAKLESDSYDECLQLLMRKGVDINQLNSSNETPLSLAVVNLNEGMAKSLITAHCDVNMKVGADFQPILSTAIENITIADILIDAGCDINITDKNGVTPLMECLKYGKHRLATLLINCYMANVNAQDNQGRCVLEYPFDSVCYGLLSSVVVHTLIEAGADIHKRGGILLNKAVGRGDKRTTVLLIDNGIDIKTEDNIGDKPIALAAGNNDKELVTLLISKDCDINHQNHQGETALHKSASHGFRDLNRLEARSGIELMLKITPDVNKWEKIQTLFNRSDGRLVTEILLKSGANVNLCDNNGRTALMQAALTCNRSVLQCLLEAGADVNKMDRDGNSVLHNVMLGNRIYYHQGRGRAWVNCLKLLLINNCHRSLDTRNTDGETLFESLVYKKEIDILWYLVTENCSLTDPAVFVFQMKCQFSDTLMLSKILFESGASKPLLEYLFRGSSSDDLVPGRSDVIKQQLNDFRDFCKSRSLESRCRREIRKCIGSSIRRKITQVGLLKHLEDYVIMKDLIPEEYFTLVINDEDDDDQNDPHDLLRKHLNDRGIYLD